MSTPFMFVYRVEKDQEIDVKTALDSLLEVLRNFIDMTADIQTVEDGAYVDIKIIVDIKGVK